MEERDRKEKKKITKHPIALANESVKTWMFSESSQDLIPQGETKQNKTKTKPKTNKKKTLWIRLHCLSLVLITCWLAPASQQQKPYKRTRRPSAGVLEFSFVLLSENLSHQAITGGRRTEASLKIKERKIYYFLLKKVSS